MCYNYHINTIEIAEVRNLTSCKATLSLKRRSQSCYFLNLNTGPFSVSHYKPFTYLRLMHDRNGERALSHPRLWMNQGLKDTQLKSFSTSVTKVYEHFDSGQMGRWGGNTNFQVNNKHKYQEWTLQMLGMLLILRPL